MTILYMMVGVPGSGKSFWISNQNFDQTRVKIVSTDNIIENVAREKGLTYSDVFKSAIKDATRQMNLELLQAITDQRDIVWDQTNLTKKVRKAKLDLIPDEYRKIAVFLKTPSDIELKERLNSRPGKTIPYNVILGMKSQLEQPSTIEGFDEVIFA